MKKPGVSSFSVLYTRIYSQPEKKDTHLHHFYQSRSGPVLLLRAYSAPGYIFRLNSGLLAALYWLFILPPGMFTYTVYRNGEYPKFFLKISGQFFQSSYF